MRDLDWPALAAVLDDLGRAYGIEFAASVVLDGGDGTGNQGIRVVAFDRDDRSLPARAAVTRPLVSRWGYLHARNEHTQLLAVLQAAQECLVLMLEDPRRWTLGVRRELRLG